MSEKPKKRLPIRWLSLAEIVGLAALVIAGLGYWDTHRERTLTEKERAAEAQEKKAEAKAGALKLAFLMTGSPEADGARLRLASVHPEQVIVGGNQRGDLCEGGLSQNKAIVIFFGRQQQRIVKTRDESLSNGVLNVTQFR